MKKHRRLQDEYHFPGYRTEAAIKGIFGDPFALVIKFLRHQKKLYAEVVAQLTGHFMTERCEKHGICHAVRSAYTWNSKCDVFFVRSAGL